MVCLDRIPVRVRIEIGVRWYHRINVCRTRWNPQRCGWQSLWVSQRSISEFFRAVFRAAEPKIAKSLIYMVGGTGIEPVTPAV